jgi:uncharacterized protein YndB with AHSA1/START domain
MSELRRPQRARIGDDAVREATGKTWRQWMSALDRESAASMDHKAIVALLAEQFRIGRWWCQMVAVTYEQERGLREVNQNSDGFSVSVSRTVTAPVDRLYEAWSTASHRSEWLAEPRLQIRKATQNRSLRITWSDGLSTVEVSFYEKGRGDKAQVTVEHKRLRSADEVEKKREFWAVRLARLKAALEQP